MRKPEIVSRVQRRAIPESPPSREPIEPREPQPEEFGLTLRRVQKLSDPPVEIAAVLSTVVVTVLVFRIIGVSLWWFLFPLTWIPSYIFGSWLTRTAGNHWRKRQPDWDSYRPYQEAAQQYKIAINAYRTGRLQWWGNLKGREFEQELAKLYRRGGYSVQLNKGTKDGGVDLVLKRDGKSFLVQCKGHANAVGPGPVRDLYGTFVHQGGTEAWLISTSGFTKAARAFAEKKPIRLITILELLEGRNGREQ